MEVIKSDSDRIKKLFEKYGDKLFRVAYSILLNKDDAEDAVQDVFFKIMTNIPEFEEENGEKAWLLRVTVNRCRDILRRNKLRIYTPLEEVINLVGEKDPDTELLSIVMGLPEKYKEVLILHYFEDLTVEDTAATLGMGKSAVKMRLSRGRDMVKKRLEKGEIYDK